MVRPSQATLDWELKWAFLQKKGEIVNPREETCSIRVAGQTFNGADHPFTRDRRNSKEGKRTCP